ncbi:hypothetical protein, partial [Aliarcobacter cryaerophilus]|uniref:hypothetical protein n=1 Tax=Aliarcobacter cryaerophilus TaxID=28198 RepID=UPI0021B4EC0C
IEDKKVVLETAVDTTLAALALETNQTIEDKKVVLETAVDTTLAALALETNQTIEDKKVVLETAVDTTLGALALASETNQTIENKMSVLDNAIYEASVRLDYSKNGQTIENKMAVLDNDVKEALAVLSLNGVSGADTKEKITTKTAALLLNVTEAEGTYTINKSGIIVLNEESGVLSSGANTYNEFIMTVNAYNTAVRYKSEFDDDVNTYNTAV